MKYYCLKGTDHDCVGVALDQHHIGMFLFQDPLDTHHDLSCLLSMSPGPDIDFILGSWERKFIKEYPTSIQLQPATKARLDELKDHPRETYDDVVNRLIQCAIDDEPLSEETLADMAAVWMTLNSAERTPTSRLNRNSVSSEGNHVPARDTPPPHCGT